MAGDDSKSSANTNRVSFETTTSSTFRRNPDHSYCEQHLKDGDGQGKHCQVEACTMDPSYSVDESKPAILCGNHRAEDMQHVQQDVSCGHEGCEREVDARHPPQGGNADRFCSEHKQPGIFAARAKQCEYQECNRTPRYGPQGAFPSYCQSHKRTGMYTVRGGMLFMATRDGNAFRTADNAAEDTGATASSRATKAPRTASESGRSPVAAEPCETPTVVPDKNSRGGRNAPLSRKLCEVLGCQVHPSYGLPGTNRLRFCSGHKQEGMVALKNRPCLFPGCNTRPHYGLPRGRAVYCSKHKKKGMVHLLKEALTSGKEEKSRQRDESSPPPQKRRVLTTQPKVARHRGKRAKDAHTEVVHQGRVDADDEKRNEEVDGHEAGRGEASKRKAVATGKTSKKRGKMINTADYPAPSTSASSSSPSSSEAAALLLVHDEGDYAGIAAPAPTTLPETSKDAATASTAPPPAPAEQSGRSSRLAESSGMTPSVEMKLLLEARVSARAAAEASGTGRRARAPSRKALEASGKLRNEGVQWLTREKKEEQARLKKTLKEQRKAAAAAGLKAGQVIEALAVSVVAGGAVPGGVEGGEAALLKTGWRKLTPAEILQAAGPKLAQDGTVERSRGGQTAAAAESGLVAYKQDENEAPVAAARNVEELVTENQSEAHSAGGANSVTAGNGRAMELPVDKRAKGGGQNGSAADEAKTDYTSDHEGIQGSGSEKEEKAKRGSTGGAETGACTHVCVSPSGAEQATFGADVSAHFW